MHVATCTTFFIDLKKEGGGTGKSECNEDHEPNLAGDYMEDIIEHVNNFNDVKTEVTEEDDVSIEVEEEDFAADLLDSNCAPDISTK